MLVRDSLFRLLARLGSAGVLAVAGVSVLTLIAQGLPGLTGELVTSSDWNPQAGRFGGLSFVHGSLLTAVVALVVALPVGFGAAVYLSEMASPPVRRSATLLTEVLAAVPGVVVGFVARQALVPLTGANRLTAGLVLAVVVLPFVVSAGLAACRAVPRHLRDGSLALGATRWQTARRVLLPVARPGLLAVAALALGRALGETMAVALVVGPADRFAWSPLAPGDTIPGALVKGLPVAADPAHRAALVALAGVLLGLTVLSHVAAGLLGRRAAGPVLPVAPLPLGPRTADRLMTALLAGCQAVAVVPLLLVAGFVLVNGLAGLGPSLFAQLPPPLDDPGGLGHALLGSLLLVGLGAAWAVPVGVLAALDLGESTGRWPRLVRAVADLLADLPAVVAGVVGYVLLVDPPAGRGGFSGWAGGFALGLVMLPLVVRSAETALNGVPAGLRDAGRALGAGRWATIRRVVLPSAGPAVLAGILAAVGRAAGETAPLLLTAGGSNFWPRTPAEPTASLPGAVWEYARNLADPDQTRLGWAAALLLLAGVVGLNLLARWLGGRRKTPA
jgi:phosphate transport system permease protein